MQYDTAMWPINDYNKRRSQTDIHLYIIDKKIIINKHQVNTQTSGPSAAAARSAETASDKHPLTVGGAH